jgi:peroxiredoxin/YHS domain-containing protein
MKRWIRATLLALLMLAPLTSAVAAPSAKAICLVCKVKEGATEEEPVKAERTSEGVRYGFCSDKCAKEFDADPVAYLPLALPRPVPSFSLTDLDGRPVTPAVLKGKVVLIDFWATWCAPCRKSMPELQALHDKYASRGLTVVGISIDEGGNAKVRKFVASKKFTYPIAVDTDRNPAWDAFRVKAVPAAYLLDRDGQIVAQWTGAAPDPEELEQRIWQMLRPD